MTASYLARASLRRSWRGALVAGIALGALWGVALAAGIGARRTATAYPRMVALTRPPDVVVLPPGWPTTIDLNALQKLPGVEASFIDYGHAGIINSDDPNSPSGTYISASNEEAMRSIERLVILHGRRFDPDHVDETVINPELARKHHLRVGQTFRLSMFEITDKGPLLYARPRMRVVGIGRRSDQAVKSGGQIDEEMILTPAFYRANRKSIVYLGAFFRLRPGYDVATFQSAVIALAGREHVSFGTRRATAVDVDHANRPQVMSLMAFSALLAIATMLVGVSALRRRGRARTAPNATLTALGCPNRSRRTAEVIEASLPIGVAAAVALVTAVTLSPRFPIGVVRRIETHRGVELHLAGLGVGLLGGALIVFMGTFVGANRQRQHQHRASRAMRSRPLALGWSRDLRSVTLATSVCVALVVAALTFGASLGSFTSSPSRYGWNWNVLACACSATTTPADADGFERYDAAKETRLRRFSLADEVDGAALMQVTSTVLVEGVLSPLVGFSGLKGTTGPSVLNGRLPQRSGEVAVGAVLGRRLRRRVGDTIRLGITNSESARIVGIVAVPSFGSYPAADSPRVGDSAVVSTKQYRRLVPPGGNQTAAIHFKPRTRPADYQKILTSALQPQPDESVELQTEPSRPVDVGSLTSIRRTPLGLAAALAAVAGIGLLQALSSSVRSRRRSLAVLSALGAPPGQLASLVARHAISTVVWTVLPATAVGVVVGRRAWGAVAEAIGVRPGHVVPAALLVLAALGFFVVSLVAALAPARVALNTDNGLLRAD